MLYEMPALFFLWLDMSVAVVVVAVVAAVAAATIVVSDRLP